MSVTTGLQFSVFQRAITQRLAAMRSSSLFLARIDREELWKIYLASFPAGSNPIFRKRTEHDCSCCRHFIKTVGGLVIVVDGRTESLWDHLDLEKGHPYRIVAEALGAYVRACDIENVFLHRESTVGQKMNYQEMEGGVLTFEHFHVTLPTACVHGEGRDTVLGDHRTTKEVFLRGLLEITHDALDTVVDLIKQNSLYRGEEHQANVETFRTLKQQFDAVPASEQSLFCWSRLTLVPHAVSRIRNTVIGTLLCDISGGNDLEGAVKSFEQKVAPTNYKRPTALVTKAMIDKARSELEQLGVIPSLERRFATAHDVAIGNVLFADRSTSPHQTGDILSSVYPTKPIDANTFARIEEVPIEKFLIDIVPNIHTIEILLENRHAPNLMSLVAPVHADAPLLFKWPNGFSWSYVGDVADSIKERVKQAGGNVTGDLRCSLSWFNHDDLDLHMVEPGREEIYYGHKRSLAGELDVDMNAGCGATRVPVENISYETTRNMTDGVYSLYVHQFSRRETLDVGFAVEIEFDGTIHAMHYREPVTQDKTIEVAKIRYEKKGGFTIVESLPSVSVARTVWGVQTQHFKKVTLAMLSPNHWNGQQVGNKHYLFMLDGCRHEGQARGFYNEFLRGDLDRHRKVMELVGSKVRTNESDYQLSGLGFSSTQRNQFVCKVSGSFNRQIRVLI